MRSINQTIGSIAAALAILTSSLVVRAEEVKTVTVRGGFGCAAKEDFEKSYALKLAGDERGFIRFSYEKNHGTRLLQCPSLPPKTTYVIVQTSGADRVCIKIVGRDDCIWTAPKLVE